MDSQPKRRGGLVTYGKNTRKTVVHDFFAHEKKKKKQQQQEGDSLKPRLPLSPTSPGTQQTTEQITHHVPSSPSPVRPAHITSHSPSPVFADSTTKSSSPSATSATSEINERALYDMTSSDDEPINPAVKRRKLLQRSQLSQSTLPVVRSKGRQQEPDKRQARRNTPPSRKSASSSTSSRRPPSPVRQQDDRKHDTVQLPNPSATSPPRRRHQRLASAQDSVESPSRLPFSQLRLASDPHRRSSAELSDGLPRRARGRRRLIDKLDTPDLTEEGEREAGAIVTTPLTTVAASEHQDSVRQHNAPPQTRITSTKQTYGKSRTIYAKERSYLADMADDIDSLGGSQDSHQQFSSSQDINAVPSQPVADFEVGYSSDDAQPAGSKLKSIHELRQAGSNQKLNRELESLFEDIDPSVPTSAKSLRIHALIRLTTRMSDSTFTSIVLHAGLTRLNKWLHKFPDATTHLLVAIVMWNLSHLPQASSNSLRLIHSSLVQVSKPLLQYQHSLSDFVNDKKQNLSKQLIRTLLQFELDVFQQNLLPAHDGSHIIPATVALGALNDISQALIASKIFDVQVPAITHQHIYRIVVQSHQLSQSSNTEDIFMVKLALNFWQTCCGPFNDDLQLKPDQYRELGNATATILAETSTKSFAALHLITTLANDRSTICRALATSSLPASIVSFISNSFTRLINDAEAETEIDINTSLLNELVLGLACLIKLSEHDNDNRLSISEQELDNSEMAIDVLTHTYSKVGPHVKDATTPAQSQILVAFGYLSILLCALSLQSTNRLRIVHSLGPTPFDDVRGTAAEFLQMFMLHATQNADTEELGDDADSVGRLDESVKGFAEILAAC